MDDGEKKNIYKRNGNMRGKEGPWRLRFWVTKENYKVSEKKNKCLKNRKKTDIKLMGR